MKAFWIFATVLLTIPTFGQLVSVSGKASDSSQGVFVIEIVVNDTLSKIMKDPKNNRDRYLKLYNNPRYVVRTDSTGMFTINARATDSLYFKSYQHVTESHSVRDLLARKKVSICLKPEITESE